MSRSPSPPAPLPDLGEGSFERTRADATWDFLVVHGTPAMEDKGCSYHPRCLTCPFEVCRFEAGSYMGGSWRAREDAKRARDLRAAGVDVNGIARVLDCSRRRVFRLLAA